MSIDPNAILKTLEVGVFAYFVRYIIKIKIKIKF